MRGRDFPPEALPLRQWWHGMQRASTLAGKPIDYPKDLEHILRDAGFINFNHQEIQIPLRRFEGTGSENAWEKHLVEYFICSLTGWRDRLSENPLFGWTVSLLSRQLNVSPAQIKEICSNARDLLYKGFAKETPVYFTLYVLHG